ncbi:hypothetical protein AB0G67_18390 [Streptomyces sp. NPDC021056]|uniref:arsenate-mycothiol transferase ArsC n=1 Tax=Streptomyces sp. NPDC021056 TaxID=3155012 RepID=UPI0033FF0123
MTASPPPVPPDERLTKHVSVRVRSHITASSPGTHPGAEVEPVVAHVRTEAGGNRAGSSPKPLTEDLLQPAGIVKTMGREDASPIVPGRRYPDWPVTDPEGAPIAVMRRTHDEIYARIAEPLDSLPSAWTPYTSHSSY